MVPAYTPEAAYIFDIPAAGSVLEIPAGAQPLPAQNGIHHFQASRLQEANIQVFPAMACPLLKKAVASDDLWVHCANRRYVREKHRCQTRLMTCRGQRVVVVLIFSGRAFLATQDRREAVHCPQGALRALPIRGKYRVVY